MRLLFNIHNSTRRDYEDLMARGDYPRPLPRPPHHPAGPNGPRPQPRDFEDIMDLVARDYADLWA